MNVIIKRIFTGEFIPRESWVPNNAKDIPKKSIKEIN